MEQRPWTRHYDYNVPTSIRVPRIPVHEILSLPAGGLGSKSALYFHGTDITFYELRQLVYRFANALAGIGIKQGDRVGIGLPTCPQYVIAYYATLSLGAIVTNVNPLYTVPELKHITEHTGMTTLISIDANAEKIGQLLEFVEIPRIVLSRIDDLQQEGKTSVVKRGLDLPPGWHSFLTLLEGSGSTRRPRVDVRPEDPAQIQFTGGTTGVPKGATLTHANIMNAVLVCKEWGNAITLMTPLEKRNVLSVLPYYHVYGNVVVMNWAIMSGSTQILVDQFDLDKLIDLIASLDHLSYFPGVPTLLGAVVNHPKAEELELDRKIDLLNSGGAPMAAELIDRIKDMGIYFGEGWGMSETSSVGIANPIFGQSKVGSIGVPFPNVDVKVVDVENGEEEMPIGERGELLVKGPMVMQGYWGDAEKTAEQLKDGWLHTGDIVVRDEDDYFFIVDRKKDMIIASGHNVYPREIDEVLYQHPKILEAATIGVPHEYRGETVKAFVVLRPGETATEEEIIDFCRDKLAAYKLPRQVEQRDALPKSAVGKLLRKDLREEEAARSGS